MSFCHPSILNRKPIASNIPSTKSARASQALEQATEELDRELREGLSGDIAVAGREVSNTLTERGTLSVTVTLVCRENIAREAAIDPPDSGAGAARI